MTLDDIPTVEFEDLHRDYKARGVDLYDLMGGQGHYDAWIRRSGLPAHDAEGKASGSSKLYYRMYQQDPQGEGACPPRINFWHMLLRLTDNVPWNESPGRRHKRAPVGPRMVRVPKDPTEDELAAARARLEAEGPIPDDAWEGVRREAMLTRPLAEKTLEILTEMAERHGVEVPGLGKIFLIGMTVDC